MTRREFGLFRFRSPLLTESRFLSLPAGTEMFQFPALTLPVLCVRTGVTGHDPSWVSPFGNPWICGWLTPPQGLSQPPTSFFASRCLGIHHMRFFTCRRDARARYGVLKQRVVTRVVRPIGSNATDGSWKRERQLEGTPPLQSCTACHTYPAGSSTRSSPASRFPLMDVPRTRT